VGDTPRFHEQFGYSYDAAGNLGTRTNTGLVQAFYVNALNELTTNTRSGTLTVAGSTTGPATNLTVNGLQADIYEDWSFARTNVTAVEGLNSFTAIGWDANGRAATNSFTLALHATNLFAYDADGNLRTNGSMVLDYDDEDRLSANWVPGQWRSEFLYDALSRRRIERDYAWSGVSWTLTNEVRFIYSGKLAVQERNASNAPVITLTRGLDLSGGLAGAGGIGGLLALTESGGSTLIHDYFFSDKNGNVTTLISTNKLIVAQYSYDPFGGTLLISGPKAFLNHYRFSSKPIHEPSGYYDFLNRWYAPDLQRWINRDPIGEAAGANLFRFVGNSPVDLADPLGLLGYYYSGGGLLTPGGIVPYLEGTTWYGQAGASIYNTIPLAFNGTIGLAGDTIHKAWNQFIDAVTPELDQQQFPYAYAAAQTAREVSLSADLFSLGEYYAAGDCYKPLSDIAKGTSTLEETVVAEETTLPAGGVMPTKGGLIEISQHLSTVDVEAPEFAMYSRLTTAFENGEALTGTDAAFYQHELIESSLVDSRMGQAAAHAETLNQQGIPHTPNSQAALYHPSVIRQFPTSFNTATRAAAGAR